MRNLTELTPRETEVYNLLLKGYTIKEVADALFISEHTVKSHRLIIFQKMEVHSTHKLLAKKIEELEEKLNAA